MDGRVSGQLEQWLAGEGDRTLGTLVDVFEEKSFAIAFVLLMGVPALPLPTGGLTHVFEVITVLLALQLIAGRDQLWVPKRWQSMNLAGPTQQKFLHGLMRMIRFLERFSKPRLTFLFGHRISNAVFGVVVIVSAVAAFVAPPFTGLDTLPALGGVLVSLGVLLEDVVVVGVGLLFGALGVTLEIVLGKAAVKGVSSLL
jgi:hypothetical protein